jgi:hypothetical protein
VRLFKKKSTKVYRFLVSSDDSRLIRDCIFQATLCNPYFAFNITSSQFALRSKNGEKGFAPLTSTLLSATLG